MTTATQTTSVGTILADELYTIDELKRRLGWGDHAWRTARREGLPVRRIGKRGYVSGRAVIEWIESAGKEADH